MTTQSKSILVPFLIIAGLIFAVALAWKFIGSDETETEATKKPTVETTEPKLIEPETKAAEPEITVVDYDEPEPIFNDIPLTEEEKAIKFEKAQAYMSYGLKFSTIDRALKGLKKYRDEGDNKAAENLISYINQQFPNESIPKELLD